MRTALLTMDGVENWLREARQLMTRDPHEALALARAGHRSAPSGASRRLLGFALLNVGDTEEGLALLAPIADDLNLSSRERRLLQLARSGVRDFALAGQAKQVTRSTLRIAAVLDEFTAHGFGPECDLQQLSVGGWCHELATFQPELLLIESAWRGLNGDWNDKVAKLSSEVQAILAWCREQSVPTAFWNKEDPVHFDTFLAVAREFDVVFTTDIDCVPLYKDALKHGRVWLLPFACQPELHNPVEICRRNDAFCFAGAYYRRYPERSYDLQRFTSTFSTYRPFHIFDRNGANNSTDYTYPDAYSSYIVGTLPADKVDVAYKGYRFGVNLNSVKTSQSMFARRVFELLACNTLVVSNYSPGVRLMFGDITVTTDNAAEALLRLSSSAEKGLEGRIRLAGLRKVLAEHTYSHRLAYIAQKIGLEIPNAQDLPELTVLAKAENSDELALLHAAFSRQSLTASCMIVVMSDDLLISIDAAAPRVRHLSKSQAASMRIGELVPADNHWIAGMAPYDYYGPNYLKDLMLATRYSSHDVVGKASWHACTSGSVTMVPGPVYAEAATLALRRAAAKAELFIAQLVNDWLEVLPAASIVTAPRSSLLAIDPFNYCEGGADASAPHDEIIALVDDLDTLNNGLPIEALITAAETSDAIRQPEFALPHLTGANLASCMLPNSRVSWVCDGDDWTLSGHMAPGEHEYIFESSVRPIRQLSESHELEFHLDAGPGSYMVMAVRFLNATYENMGQVNILPNRNHRLAPPNGAEFVKFGFRVLGTGSRTIRRLILGNLPAPPRNVIARSETLLLTSDYPSYESPLTNRHLHDWLKYYQKTGCGTIDIFQFTPAETISWREYQNVDIVVGSAMQLNHILSSSTYKQILISSFEHDVWDILQPHIGNLRATALVDIIQAHPIRGGASLLRTSANAAEIHSLAALPQTSEPRVRFASGNTPRHGPSLQNAERGTYDIVRTTAATRRFHIVRASVLAAFPN